MSKLGRFLLVYFGLTVFASAGALVYLYPHHPVTLVGALVWVALSLPVAVLLELVGNSFLSRRISDGINPDTSRISVGRMSYALIACLAMLALVGIIIGFSEAQFGEFVEANYSDKW
jgi:hypothetical protein